MKLDKLGKRTHWIGGGTNTGVYVFDDKTALLIDVGLGGERPKKLIDIFEQNNIRPTHLISTHEHEDHVGGNFQIRQEYPDIIVYSTRRAKIYMENPDIYVDFLVGGRRPKKLVDAIEEYMPGPAIVDYIVSGGDILNINGHDFEIIDCSGHTESSIGVITDDRVGFFSDQMVTDNSLAKFDFLFMCDYPGQIRSLNRIFLLDFELGVLGHSSRIFKKNELVRVADYNYRALLNLLEFLLTSMEEPKTFDEIIKDFIDKKSLLSTYIAFLEYRNSLNSAISYLLDSGVIEYSMDDNIMRYKLK